jgi:nickel transport system permease protein
MGLGTVARLARRLALAASVPLGAWAALDRDRLPDHLVRAVAFVGVSVPNFRLGFLLVLLFSVTLGWLPPLGRGGVEHMVMPVVAVALMSLCINARLRGLPEGRVVRTHILRNALLPIVTAVGMHVGELLGGTLVIENIFGWPGVGRFAVSAIYNRDCPVLQCFTLLMTLIFVLCNLTVDVLYAWLDPRIRLAGGTAR